MQKHIPTLTILFFTEHNLYGYEYDDVQGLTQTEYGFLSLDSCLGSAFKHLKTFLVLPEIENR